MYVSSYDSLPGVAGTHGAETEFLAYRILYQAVHAHKSKLVALIYIVCNDSPLCCIHRHGLYRIFKSSVT